MFTAPAFWQSLLDHRPYSVAATVGSITVGLVAALVVARPVPRARRRARVMLLPYVAPVVATTFVWQVALNPQYGVVNASARRCSGGTPGQLPQQGAGCRCSASSPRPTALLTVIVFEIWRYFPFAFLFLTARLRACRRELEEAAVVDGATPWQKFWFVVLPQLLPTVALLVLLRIVMAFNEFDDVYLLTGGAAGTQVASVAGVRAAHRRATSAARRDRRGDGRGPGRLLAIYLRLTAGRGRRDESR